MRPRTREGQNTGGFDCEKWWRVVQRLLRGINCHVQPDDSWIGTLDDWPWKSRTLLVFCLVCVRMGQRCDWVRLVFSPRHTCSDGTRRPKRLRLRTGAMRRRSWAFFYLKSFTRLTAVCVTVIAIGFMYVPESLSLFQRTSSSIKPPATFRRITSADVASGRLSQNDVNTNSDNALTKSKTTIEVETLPVSALTPENLVPRVVDETKFQVPTQKMVVSKPASTSMQSQASIEMPNSTSSPNSKSVSNGRSFEENEAEKTYERANGAVVIHRRDGTMYDGRRPDQGANSFSTSRSGSYGGGRASYKETESEKAYERVTGKEIVHKKDGTTYERREPRKR